MSEDFPRSESEVSEQPYEHHQEFTGAKSEVPTAARRGSWLALIVLLLLVVAGFAYGFHQHRVASQLTAQNSAMAASLNDTRAEIQAMSAKLNDLSAAQAQKPAPALVQHAISKHVASHRRRADDPRWKQLQSQLTEQGKRIDATQQDLTNARTELTGSIARTHDELVVLQKKGERSYFEFDIDKNGEFQHDGPVGVRLKKANTKHQYADLEMLVDDFKVSKKHVNIFEPVTFYAAENGQPVELVINSISKNHIHGYVSQPKYRSSELQAMSGASNTTAPAPEQRQRLELPKN